MLRRRSAASREPSIIHHRTPVCSEFARIVRPARLRKPEGEDLRRENSRNALVVERQVLTRSATPAPISARLFKPLGSVAMQFRICRTKETKCKRHVDTLAERRSAEGMCPGRTGSACRTGAWFMRVVRPFFNVRPAVLACACLPGLLRRLCNPGEPARHPELALGFNDRRNVAPRLVSDGRSIQTAPVGVREPGDRKGRRSGTISEAAVRAR
jgi:hypothetical protein